MNASTLLQQQSELVQAQLHTLDQLTRDLTPAQLAWQPAPGKWSILECIEHLNLAMAPYLREMNTVLPTAPQGSVPTFRSGFWGKRLPKMFQPKSTGRIKWKMKTMARFQPQVSPEDHARVLTDFRAQVAQLSGFIADAEKLDLNRARIVSAIGSWLKFRLGDAFRFVTAHNARHLQQAQGVREMMESSAAKGHDAPLAASL
ncbi:MAG: DinB family protein [Bacteroidota bacterium]